MRHFRHPKKNLTFKHDRRMYMEERITRGKAIRLKCLDCCCGNSAEVRRCPSVKCPLWRYRMGSEQKADALNFSENQTGGINTPPIKKNLKSATRLCDLSTTGKRENRGAYAPGFLYAALPKFGDCEKSPCPPLSAKLGSVQPTHIWDGW